jgi:hypothetical protein
VQAEIKIHHRKLNHALQSLKVMLANKRHSIAHSEWQQLVEKTRQSVISNPYQYFDTELPTQETLRTVVDRIFQQFLDDQSTR